jgi:hypothetical protein
VIARGLLGHELQRDGEVELHVAGGHDDAHSSGAEHPLDPVFAGENIAPAEQRAVVRGRAAPGLR